MERIKSKSDKRLIVEGLVNGMAANFLIDTGASVALMDYNQRKDYDLVTGRKYSGTVKGVGGEIGKLRHCDTFVDFHGKVIPQFLLADIEAIVDSVKRETGIEILGIISLPQMKMCGLGVDANDNEIIIE